MLKKAKALHNLTCCTFFHDYLITGYADGLICVWNIEVNGH